MNGEEAAAASLFGSEDSGSDLFATLGADTTSPQPSLDNIFPNETVPFDTKGDTYDFLSGQQNYDAYTEFSEYSSQPTEALTHTTSDNVNFTEPPVQSPWSKYEDNDAGSQHNATSSVQHDVTQSTTAAYNNYQSSAYLVPSSTYPSYGAYDPPAQTPVPSTTTPSYGNYSTSAPVQSYTPHNVHDPPSTAQSSYASYVPPSTKKQSYAPYGKPVAVNTRSSYSAYDPPAPSTNLANYATYDPPVHKGPLTPSNNGPYNPPPSNNPTPQTQPYHNPENVYAGSSGETYPTYSKPYAQTDAHPPLAPPPVKSTITRPKVSNAYDPPFPVTLPTRRGSRPAAVSAQQAYAQYDKPVEPYIARNTTPPQTHTDNGVIQSAYSNNESDLSRHLPTHTTHGQPMDRMSPGPSRDEQYHGIQTSAMAETDTSSYFPHHEGAHTNEDHPEDGVATQITNQGMMPNYMAEDSIRSQDSTNEHNPTTSRANPPFSNQQAHISPKQSMLASPASIPLPFSPLEDVQQHAYTPQLGAKKEVLPTKDLYDPYTPKLAQNSTNYIPRTSSPLAVHNSRQNEPNRSYTIPPINSNMSSPPFGSVPKPIGTTLTSGNQYAPPSNTNHNVPVARQTSQWSETNSGAQELVVKAATGLYAPSPSLIGANDPLSRTSARAPVINFGFGGKMITCFHGMPGLNAGFDVAFSSRTTSELKIRTLHKILPQSVLNGVDSSYPGPLLADPGPTSLSLVRPNVATQTKMKKASILNYLAGRISEIHQGLGYLSNADKRIAEDKLILVKVLSVMVENDGRLLGTPQAESAVRSTLVPRLEGTQALQDAVTLQASFTNTSSSEVPISVTTLKPSTLDKIEEFLLQGDRRQAFQYAEEQKLWAHAMIIASSIDKESWKEVVHDFIRTELAPKEEPENSLLAPTGSTSDSQLSRNNRESLRVAYSLFSGQGPAAIQEMAPTSLLQRSLGQRFQPPMVPAATPRTPNFAAMQSVSMPPPVPSASLATWAETVAMIMSSLPSPETSSALTALGDQLLANNRVEAAHVCYLLSPQTSLLGGVGSPAARLTLLGSKNPSDVMGDTDALVFSEILEFAMSLVPVAKGQEPFHGIPHLQAYRFVKAIILAEVGEIQLANRYCEAITTSLSQASPYTNLALLEQLQGLQQRLSGIFPGDKSGSWIGGKISKPSLDSIGGWLEGRFTKLVTGESETAPSSADPLKTVDQPFAGPFAHYSNISSNTPSARSSPQPQPLPATTSMGPPQRTASAMATASTYAQQIHHVERSSSAMDHVRQRPSVNTYAPTSNSLSSSQSSPIGFGQNSQNSNPYAPRGPDSLSPDDESGTPIQTSSWWSSSNDANGSSATPTAATFMKIDESSVQASNDGFISLMDSHSYSVGPSQHTSKAPSPAQAYNGDDDDDDLGLGNSRPKSKPEREENGAAKEEKPAAAAATKPPTPAPAAPANNAASGGGSWLGRWWKKSDTPTPGPIKASLGEESAFYYDKEQKRWVNRKAGSAEAEKPAAPPPPPSRAQTASPGMTGSKPQPPPGNAPPIRSASAIDLGEPPMKAPMRIRSNLAPPTESAPSTPTGTRLTPGPPPPARPKSQATKRNIRSRYVDVLQQEGGTPPP